MESKCISAIASVNLAMSAKTEMQRIFSFQSLMSVGLALLLACSVLVACKPTEIPVACTPLPILDGYETAMVKGGKMRLRVPKHSARLTENCKEISEVYLSYYWHKGELVSMDDNLFNPDLSKSSKLNPVKIYLTAFQLVPEVSPVKLQPWQFEGAVRHYKYPLEFYPKFHWAEADQPPAKAPPDVTWGVVGTKDVFTPYLRTTYCNIVRSPQGTQADVVNGEFAAGYSDAKCRGEIYGVKGDKVAFGMIDVWSNNAHDIDKIYAAAIAKLQTYIQE